MFTVSFWDLDLKFFLFPAMTHAWPKNCVVVLKSSLKYVPGFNLCTYLCCAIFINRFNKTRAHQSIGDAEKAILEKKVRF
jgi:hypothetical protein